MDDMIIIGICLCCGIPSHNIDIVHSDAAHGLCEERYEYNKYIVASASVKTEAFLAGILSDIWGRCTI